MDAEASRRAGIRKGVAGGAAVLLLCSIAWAQPAFAGYHEDGECDPKATQMVQGGGTGDTLMMVQVCTDSGRWETTATYYSYDEHMVISEPRLVSFDYSGYGSVNPYAADGYAYRKARELYTDPVSWRPLVDYAQKALSAKPRAVSARDSVVISDACQVYPVRWTEDDNRSSTYNYWLAPIPKPDGGTGTITYSLKEGLTAEQRTTIMGGLLAYDEARVGTTLPKIELATGTETPTISFEDGTAHIGDRIDAAETAPREFETTPDGLRHYKNGTLYLSSRPADLTERTVAHEILHVLGFGHIPFNDPAHSVMSPNLDFPWGIKNSDNLTLTDGAPPLPPAIDACTKLGMQLAK
ncbi:hypothetical protein KPL76_07070 [Subtercola sp. PAMC28395]|uniref:hypothetical protein n=1 Tax=Subtercola sp. PAMC28395 TaxID=2846775 RepID=UPI001C0E84E4|nr:hypothetical protein [Subtercola sp. PAMC28395]QWT25098.1 hypothetical protein KPL76_07070 [Subtercola sp. PAMC28395]